MKNQIILHIPHSSINIPCYDAYIVDKEILEKEILKLTDWYTDDLFFSEEDIIIKSEFSRIFCDTERFMDESKEIMAQFGMGVLYKKNDDGTVIRILDHETKEMILNDYYWTHHKKFTLVVDDQLAIFEKALILDCHSFPSEPLNRDIDKNPKRPDFNIGTDAYHTPKKLIEISKDFFKNAGYSLGIDWPYKGSIVPIKHYRQNKNVISIMLEINRALYLKEPSNERSANYTEIKKVTGEFIKSIKTIL